MSKFPLDYNRAWFHIHVSSYGRLYWFIGVGMHEYTREPIKAQKTVNFALVNSIFCLYANLGVNMHEYLMEQ